MENKNETIIEMRFLISGELGEMRFWKKLCDLKRMEKKIGHYNREIRQIFLFWRKSVEHIKHFEHFHESIRIFRIRLVP